jgi:hypothetical protein
MRGLRPWTHFTQTGKPNHQFLLELVNISHFFERIQASHKVKTTLFQHNNCSKTIKFLK